MTRRQFYKKLREALATGKYRDARITLPGLSQKWMRARTPEWYSACPLVIVMHHEGKAILNNGAAKENGRDLLGMSLADSSIIIRAADGSCLGYPPGVRKTLQRIFNEAFS